MRKQGDDVRAHGYFKRAYSLARTPSSAAQLGLVEQALAYIADAELHLGEALEAPDAWVDGHREVLEKSRSDVRAHLGQVTCSNCPTGTTVELPGREAVPVKPGSGLWVAPGRATLTFTPPGAAPTERTVSVTVGSTVSVSLAVPSLGAQRGDLRALGAAGEPPRSATARAGSDSVADDENADAAGPPVTPTDRPGRPAADDSAPSQAPVLGLVVAGVSAGVGIGGYFVYRAGVAKHDAIADDIARNRPYDPANGNYKTLGGVGLAMMVGGAAGLVGGAIVYLVERARSSDASPPPDAISFSVVPSGSRTAAATSGWSDGFVAQVGSRF
jgi:hypothetical protein